MGRVIDSTPHVVVESKSHDGKHSLSFDKTTHIYRLNGVRVPGATTIGSVYPKGEGLIRWMIEQGMKEYEEKSALERGGGVGTFLHTYAELFETGRMEQFDWRAVDSSPYQADIRAVIARFNLWRATNCDTVLMMEATCGSTTLAAAGCIDTLRRREIGGVQRLVLHDYKTSKSIYVTHLIQVVGGYRRMMREWYGLDIPYVEITKFPKQADVTMETLLCDADGWQKTEYIDGVPYTATRVEVPGLFAALEAQFERNYGTYRFQKDIENKLSPPYKKK